MKRRARSATAVLACLLAAGCSSSSGKRTAVESEKIPPPKVTSIPKIADASDLTLPIQRYLYSDRELSLLMRAREKRIAVCMHGLGIGYTPPKQQKNAGPKTITERRYGLADPALAKRSGYHLPGVQVRPQPTLPAAEFAALTGQGAGSTVPKGGCSGQAQRDIAGNDTFGPADLAQDLNARSFRLSMRDTRVRAVFTSWASCMKRDGFSYPDPLKVMADPKFSQASPGKGEQAVASADVECKRRVNLIGIWYTVESAYQRKLIENNYKALEDIAVSKRDQLNTAEKIAAGS